jgi:hypothetical protein
MIIVYGERGCEGIPNELKSVLRCKESLLQELEFCSFMNGETTDEAFNTALLPNGMTYAKYYDRSLNQTFTELQIKVNNMAKLYGFDVCQNCLDKMKMLMCANAFPMSGLRKCVATYMLGSMSSTCPDFCGCPEDGLCSLYKNGTSCGYKFAKTPKAIACYTKKFADTTAVTKECFAHFTPIEYCIDTMSSCGCIADKSKVVDFCGRYFTSYGKRELPPTWPTSTCKSSYNWCSTTSSSLGDSIAGLFGLSTKINLKESFQTQLVCPNPNMCLGVPTPLPIPSLKTPLGQPPNASALVTSLLCIGSNDASCQRGCINNRALAYDPFARIDDKSCQEDILSWLNWIRKNFSWLLAVIIVAVVAIICCIVTCITILLICLLCCIKRRRKKGSVKSVGFEVEHQDSTSQHCTLEKQVSYITINNYYNGKGTVRNEDSDSEDECLKETVAVIDVGTKVSLDPVAEVAMYKQSLDSAMQATSMAQNLVAKLGDSLADAVQIEVTHNRSASPDLLVEETGHTTLSRTLLDTQQHSSNDQYDSGPDVKVTVTFKLETDNNNENILVSSDSDNHNKSDSEVITIEDLEEVSDKSSNEQNVNNESCDNNNNIEKTNEEKELDQKEQVLNRVRSGRKGFWEEEYLHAIHKRRKKMNESDDEGSDSDSDSDTFDDGVIDHFNTSNV